MKKYKNIHIVLLLVFVAGMITSCSEDFLHEELTTRRNTDYYKTEKGVLELAVATYYKVLNDCAASEWFYSHANYGTDEFHVGADGSNGPHNSYNSGLASITITVNSNTVKADAYWNSLYLGVATSNLLIDRVNEINSTNEKIKKNALGEGYFFRAFAYLRLVRQFGAVPLIVEPSTGLMREFYRAPPQEVLEQVIEDFTKAYDLLPTTSDAHGKLTKYTAAHFLAKAYLTRTSEINDSWNASTKERDLQEAIRLADEVIARHPLADDFSELWNYTEPDGPNERSNEIILAAQCTADVASSTGSHQHLFFLTVYDDLPYMQRDIAGGRPWSRLATTYYMYKVYDLVNDSRFWKSFKTKYKVNKPSGDVLSTDLGIMFVINQPGDDRYSAMHLQNAVTYEKTGRPIPTVFVAYPQGETEDGALYATTKFPPLNKHIDASRVTVNETRGLRDLILARSAETYLIAAEAEIRLAKLGSGFYGKALDYINAVRRRAAYKNGEDRAAYVDGGAAYPSSPTNQGVELISYIPENSYYESNNISKTVVATDLIVTSTNNLPAEDEAIIAQLGYTSEYDRMLCFLLNERARELCGEFHRWEDLSRTQTLVDRAKAYNPEAAPNIKPHHSLRPIPQTYLDGIRIDGRTLTPDEKQAQQNPGY
jgi:hypothetical protein